MAESQDERLTGDLPVAPAAYGEEDRPSLSHEVIAAYVADAARSVPGVVDLHSPLWKGLSYHGRDHHGGVVVRDSQPGTVSLDIHLRIAWGSYIPELASAVEQAVRQRVTALLNLDIDSVTLFIDEITGPLEVTAGKED